MRTERESLEALLANPQAMRRQVVREIEADAKQYGDARRTLIEAAERTTIDLRVAEEPVTVIVSEMGWVRARQGHGHDASQFGYKAGDGPYGAFEVMTTDQLFAVATNGRVYSVPVSQLPSARGDGAPITSLVDLEPGSRVDHAFAAPADAGVLLATSGGNGLLCQAADLVGRTRQGKSFLSLDEGDVPLRPALFSPGMARVLCLSAEGKALVFALSDLKVLRNGGRGVILMGLDARDTLRQALVFGDAGVRIRGAGRGGKAVDRVFGAGALEAWAGARARKGRFLEPRVKDALLEVAR